MRVLIGTCLSGKSTLARILSKNKSFFDIDSFNSSSNECNLKDIKKFLEDNQYNNLEIAVIHGITVSNRLYLLGSLKVPIDIIFCRTSMKTALLRNKFRLNNQIPIDVIKYQFDNLQDIDSRLEKYNSVRYITTK